MDEELSKNDILNKLLSEQEALNVSFHRSMSSADRAVTAMKLANTEIALDPSVRSTILALSTYLPQKWSLKHNITTGLMQNKYNTTIAEMVDIHRILSEIMREPPKLSNLAYRRIQLQNTQQITALVEKAADHLHCLPVYGERYYKVIYGIHINPGLYGEKGPSFYEVKTHYIPAVRQIAAQYGRRFDYLFSRALYSKHSLEEEIDELYHNTNALMKCYSKLLWRFGEDSYLLQKIRKCKTMEDISAFGRYFTNPENEKNILEYLILIQNSLEQVRYFPKNGALYYEILSIQPELAMKKISLDDALRKKLHITKSTYKRKKREAYDVLSIVLWGYSTRAIISYLTNKELD